MSLFLYVCRVEPPPVALHPATSNKSKPTLSLFAGKLKTSTVITILIALLAALYVSAALMMIRIDRLHTAYLNHPLVSPERFTQDRLLHYLNTNLDQIVKVWCFITYSSFHIVFKSFCQMEVTLTLSRVKFHVDMLYFPLLYSTGHQLTKEKKRENYCDASIIF